MVPGYIPAMREKYPVSGEMAGGKRILLREPFRGTGEEAPAPVGGKLRRPAQNALPILSCTEGLPAGAAALFPNPMAEYGGAAGGGIIRDAVEGGMCPTPISAGKRASPVTCLSLQMQRRSSASPMPGSSRRRSRGMASCRPSSPISRNSSRSAMFLPCLRARGLAPAGVSRPIARVPRRG